MFGAAFSSLMSQLEKRLITNAVFPALLLALGLVAVWEATGEGIGAGVKRLADLDGTSKAAVAVLAVGAVGLAAALLDSQSRNLINWYSGHGGIAAWSFFKQPSTEYWQWQQAEARRHHEQEGKAPRFGVPLEGEVGPTFMGTLGYANADYAKRAYGMDLRSVWPRLLPVLPPELQKEIANAESSVEQLLALSTVSTVFGAAAAVICAYHRALLVGTSSALASFALGFLLYRAALAPLEQWSRLVRTSVDLHRATLLDQLQMQRPRTTSEERRLWERMHAALHGTDERPLALVPPGD